MSIKIENLSKKWVNFAIKNINLEINRGEYFVILGPTGAGKTLLLELIAGFYTPDAGKIIIDTVDVTSFPPEKRRLGYVPQNYMLFPHMTVEENVEFGLKMHGFSRLKRKKMVDEVLELAGLSKLRSRLPETLSGGEKQKTALARALIIKPKILLLDEPLSALDVNTQKKLREELKKLHENLNITTVHVTHNHSEAYFLAEKLAIMKDGTIIQKGSPDEVFYKPKNNFVASFVGFENLFDGKIVERHGNLVVVDIGDIKVEAVTSLEAEKCTLGVRPDDIIILESPSKSSMRNLLKGKISNFISMGSIVNLTVKVKEKSFMVLITKRSFEEMNLQKGKEVYIAFKASSVHVM